MLEGVRPVTKVGRNFCPNRAAEEAFDVGVPVERAAGAGKAPGGRGAQHERHAGGEPALRALLVCYLYDDGEVDRTGRHDFDLQRVVRLGVVAIARRGAYDMRAQGRDGGVEGMPVARRRPQPAVDVRPPGNASFTAPVLGIERVGGFGGKADVLAGCTVYMKDPGCFRHSLEALDAATAGSVQATAQRWLSQGDFNLRIDPFPTLQAEGDGVDRSSGVPAVDSFPDLSLPKVQRAGLSNGIEVQLAERDSVPVVQVQLLFDAGYAADIDAPLGTSSFTMAMLDEGTRSRGALEIATEMETLGAQIGAGSGLDSSSITLSALVENAADFATARVRVTAVFDARRIRISVADDGPGFSPEVLSRLGEPYVTTRPRGEDSRSAHEGMGLGFFIARTLLERTGAQLAFGAATSPEGVAQGALVAVSWPREAIEAGPA